MKKNSLSRRDFITTVGTMAGAALIPQQAVAKLAATPKGTKRRLALVGTGVRGVSFWGKYIVENYSDVTEFVALCDNNPGRLKYAHQYIGAKCNTYTSFDEMLEKETIDLLMVTTVDATHDEFIVKALEKGIDVATEKPMTTDEFKCHNIIKADEKSEASVFMGFNYRYGLLFTELKRQLQQQKVGEITSIDFNWYLNVFHGASYFRRWHGEKEKSGSLLLHKSAHHFDLLNWFINSEPVEVHAFGALEHYGKNNPFRGKNCRNCEHTNECKFYWDINKNEHYMKLYAENEKYDGYIRDNCLWRDEIDIYDKMAVQVKYANNVQVSYSLTTYSPFEGFRIAFNGKQGRMETWEGIPWRESKKEDQATLHVKEMDQSHTLKENNFHEITIQRNFDDYEQIQFPYVRSGHWGGDKIMFDLLFRGKRPHAEINHEANSRDGAMAVLIGIAARKSIDEKRVVHISELTHLVPQHTTKQQ
ncbi:MAG: 4,5-dihydroxyphthalate dehydrogenase [Bacteroidetes bacterium HGW-Bacteroidetes-4]|jgi:predicted dehydrogenase|nr:MAG: 4,5-dihydroxyphthalate dehydrogenase [Bacteroidetes bacterium HGW-Bacteroidetes-4]